VQVDVINYMLSYTIKRKAYVFVGLVVLSVALKANEPLNVVT